MAHPDPKRSGSEKGQREHAGPESEATDAGLKTHSQGARGAGPNVIPDSDPSKPRPEAAGDNARGDLDDRRRGIVAPGERSDAEGPVRGGMDRDSGAGAAAGHDAGGASRRPAAGSGRAGDASARPGKSSGGDRSGG